MLYTTYLSKNFYRVLIFVAVWHCDGIWDVLTHSEACEIVFKHLKEGNHTSSIDHHLVNEAAEEIVNESLHKGTQDNVSCVVVNLHTI